MPRIHLVQIFSKEQTMPKNWRTTLSIALLGGMIALPLQTLHAETHDDGTHTDDGHGSGGNGQGGPGGNGNGGHGQGADGGHGHNGNGGHGEGEVAAASDSDPANRLPLIPRGSRGNPGTYFRFDIGLANGAMGDAFWQPPGFPSDPEVHFDLSGESGFTGSVAIGRYFKPNLRAEGAVVVFGEQNISGPWSYTVPETTGPHADVSGAVSSVAFLVNGYYDLTTGAGGMTPYLVGGVGLASNTMSNWTRINPDAGRTTRSFEGAQNTDFAWSVGLGASVDMSKQMGRPASLDFSLRHYDLGQASGSATSLPGSGAGGDPVTPLTVDVNQNVLSIGLTFPLGG
jgi:hypothetical protein